MIRSIRLQQYILSILFVFFIACKPNLEKKIALDDFTKIAGNAIPEIDNLSCNDIIAFDSIIIVNDWSSRNGFFSVFSFPEFKRISTFCTNGKGPGEFLSPFFDENIIRPGSVPSFFAFDLNLKAIRDFKYAYTYSNNEPFFAITKSYKFPAKIYPSLNISYVDSIFFGNEIMSQEGLFYKYDTKNNKKISTAFLPIRYYDSHRGPIFDHIFYNKPKVNLQKGIIITGMKFFNQIHFYDFNCNFQKTITIASGVEPTFNQNDILEDSSYIYIVDIYSTEKYFYVLYDGKRIEDYSNNSFTSSKVLVFDWDGKHINTYEIMRSSVIAVDPNDNILFTYSQDSIGESHFLYYFLNLN